jgi:hypothetical protein
MPQPVDQLISLFQKQLEVLTVVETPMEEEEDSGALHFTQEEYEQKKKEFEDQLSQLEGNLFYFQKNSLIFISAMKSQLSKQSPMVKTFQDAPVNSTPPKKQTSTPPQPLQRFALKPKPQGASGTPHTGQYDPPASSVTEGDIFFDN